MTITGNNFDIYNIANKASAPDRVTIFFDEIFAMSINYKRKFDDQQMEALRDSFRGNQEASVFNTSLHNCLCINLFISQIEKIITDAKHIETTLRLTASSIDDKYLLDWLMSETLKEIEKNKIITNKKEIKKIFNGFKNKVQKLCLISLGDDVIKSFVEKTYNLGDEEDCDSYNKKFLQFFRSAVAKKAETASKYLDILKDFYAKSDAKFEVVDGKIKDLEGEIVSMGKFAKFDADPEIGL